MNIHQSRRRLERKDALAGGWNSQSASTSASLVFERSFELAEAARGLERVAGAPGSAGATAASLSCVTSTFESLANAILNVRGLVLSTGTAGTRAEIGVAENDLEQLGRLLYAINQNLRFAAEASDLGRQAADQEPHMSEAGTPA